MERIPLGDCGCYLLDNGPHGDQPVVHCPRHKPAWRAALEALLRGQTTDAEDARERARKQKGGKQW